LTGKTDELSQDDSLSEAAKAEIMKVKSELETFKQAQQQQIQQQAQAKWNGYHDVLAQKYKGYDRNEIDALANQLARGEINVTPEYLYRVLKYEEDIHKAYEMGRRESSRNVEDKRNASSISGINAVRNDSIMQDAKEDNRSFLQRIIASRIGNGAPK